MDRGWKATHAFDLAFFFKAWSLFFGFGAGLVLDSSSSVWEPSDFKKNQKQKKN